MNYSKMTPKPIDWDKAIREYSKSGINRGAASIDMINSLSLVRLDRLGETELLSGDILINDQGLVVKLVDNFNERTINHVGFRQSSDTLKIEVIGSVDPTLTFDFNGKAFNIEARSAKGRYYIIEYAGQRLKSISTFNSLVMVKIILFLVDIMGFHRGHTLRPEDLEKQIREEKQSLTGKELAVIDKTQLKLF